MNFKIIKTKENYAYETLFNAYQNEEIVNNRFNVIHDQKSYRENITHPYSENFSIDDKQKEFIYSVPVIIIQHCDMSDFGDADELQVVLNVGNASVDKPFPDGEYRNKGDTAMRRNIETLAAKIEAITNVKPVIGCSDTYCYCYTKRWSYKEWERIVDEILKIKM